MKKYFLALGVSALVLYLHILGLEHFLYFYFWWYDWVLHLLGGVALALFFSIFTKNWKHIIIAVLLTATAWEIFEYVLHIAGNGKENYFIDTLTDYAMALVGTVLVIWRS